MPERLFLIDAHAHIYQAFYAIRGLTGPDGEPVNAVYGFAKMLRKIRKEHDPDYVAVVFDPPGKVFRHKMYEDYKATRKPMPDELRRQLPVIREMLQAQGIPALMTENFEADDVMASAARVAAEHGVASVLVTTDKDAEQLIDDMTTVLHMHKDREVWLDPPGLEELKGLTPRQVVDLMSLAGDATDNVPGVRGIGPKTAAKLIKEFGSVENLYANLDKVGSATTRKRLEENRDAVELSRRLVLIDRKAPVELDLEKCRPPAAEPRQAVEFYRALGFESLIDTAPAAPVATQASLFGAEAKEGTAAGLQDVHSHKKDYRTLRTRKDVRALADELRKHAPFCVDLETTGLDPHTVDIVGLAFSWSAHQGVYVATAGPKGEKVCPAGDALAELKPLLQDAEVGKIGQNLKYDMQVLKRYDVALRGIVCDTMVASYLLEPSERGHGLDALALRHLGYRTVKISELIGKGRDEILMSSVPVERVAEYACEDADVTFQLAEKLMAGLGEFELLGLFRDLELPLVSVLAEMEWRGVKINGDELGALSGEFEKEMAQLQERIYEEAGAEFNVASTKQLSEVLFGKLKLPRPAGKARTTGYSTDSDVLDGLAAEHAIARDLLRWREVSKLKSTYADALIELVNPATGRLHTSLNQTGTATGRLSSSGPNLQNIPVRTALGRRIRRAFVPSERDMSLVGADYSQIELRVLAHCSGDETLQEAFRRDSDIHRFVAAQVNEVPEDEVTAEMRQKAKAVNFGIVYGQSSYGLAKQIDVSYPEASEFIRNYFERYPKVKAFIGKTIAQARKDGYVRTLLGRRRPIVGIRSGGAVRAAAERVAVNSIVQGSAADLIKKAMININRGLPEISPRGAMLLQIHDELLFEVPDEDVEDVRAFVIEQMSGALQLSVPLKVKVAVGKNWEQTK